jgi:hypothetical protein
MVIDIGYTNYQNALKVLYLNDVTIQDLVNDDNPLLAMLAKATNFVGDTLPQPVIMAYNQGNSSGFTNAQANQTGGNIQKFILTRFPIYGLATIDRQTMLASKDGKGGFLPAAEFAIDGAFVGLANQMSQVLYGDGSGVIGQASALSTGVITLVNPDSAVNFEVGMTLGQWSTYSGGVVATQLGANAYVIAVDQDQGTVTVSTSQGGSAASPASWTASGYLVQDGNANAQPPGLLGWIPFDRSGLSTTFFGVNRSLNPSRLAGVTYDGTGETVEEAILSASAKLSKLSKAKPDALFVSPTVFATFEKALQGRAVYIEHKEGNIGFTGIKAHGAKGPIEVYQDRSNTTQYGWLLTMKHWKIRSLMSCPHVVQDDITGNILRVSNQDAFEVRLAGYWVLACEMPSANAVIKFQV